VRLLFFPPPALSESTAYNAGADAGDEEYADDEHHYAYVAPVCDSSADVARS
jgi:hypothetical protein